MKVIWTMFVALLLCGCGDNTATTPPAVATASNPKLVLTLRGPGGEVAIGDPLDRAREAFPAPDGAATYDTSMSFAVVTDEGWAWTAEGAGQTFEAAAKKGKVIALAAFGGSEKGEPQATLSLIGQPTRKAESASLSSKVTAYVWEAGDNVRFWIHTTKPVSILPAGGMIIIGSKNQLGALGYQYDNPELIIQQLELSESAEMKKIFEDAKKRAKETAKRRQKKGP